VRRTLSSAKGGPRFTAPKTAKSRRGVRLTDAAVAALARHGAAQEKERARLANLWEDSDDLVFRSTTGSPLNRYNLVKRSFKPLLRKAGLPDIPFQGLRHTAASLLGVAERPPEGRAGPPRALRRLRDPRTPTPT